MNPRNAGLKFTTRSEGGWLLRLAIALGILLLGFALADAAPDAVVAVGMLLMLGGLVGIIYPIARIGLTSRGFSAALLAVGFVLTGHAGGVEERSIAHLKASDPDAYLSELREISESSWRSALEEMKPEEFGALVAEEERQAALAAEEERRMAEEQLLAAAEASLAAEAARLAQAEQLRLNAEAQANYDAYQARLAEEQVRLAEEEAKRPEREQRGQSFYAASSQNFPVGDVKTNCQAEWPSDFNMQAYCFSEQQTAFETIAAKRPGLDTVNAGTLSNCEAEWPGDYRMQAYCLEQQMEARMALPAVGGDLPPDVGAGIRSTCEAEWQDDFSMQAYCVKQQAAGWRQLNR